MAPTPLEIHRFSVRTYQWLSPILALLLLAQSAMAQDAPVLKPYVARYHVKYRGISGGDIEFTLKSEGNGRYTYSTHLIPNFLGSLFISDQAEDQTWVQVDGTSVKPLKFRSDDGTQDTLKDISYDFDWSTASVNGRYKNQNFRLDLPAGVQDRLSIQLFASLAMQAGRDPGHLIMIEKDELQEYNITRTGTDKVRTDAGEFDVVVFKSEREGSSRMTRYWYAPKLGYIPVHAERLTKGKVDIVMELLSYRAL
jgi:hypothetical protein